MLRGNIGELKSENESLKEINQKSEAQIRDLGHEVPKRPADKSTPSF